VQDGVERRADGVDLVEARAHGELEVVTEQREPVDDDGDRLAGSVEISDCEPSPSSLHASSVPSQVPSIT